MATTTLRSGPPRASSYDAVVFDLDGVLTRTARLHAAAWKRLFDEFLARRAGAGADRRPFDDADYRRYVDGKPRHDGVVDFLASRGIGLSPGRPADPPDAATVCGLGNRKNRYFLEALDAEGVEVFPGSVAFLDAARAAGASAAVVSSSRNARAVLERAGLLDRFGAVVDGQDAERLGLAGKPAPAAFLEAARRLGATPRRSVVVEDALAGVRAGAAGDFGCVVGVDRSGRPHALLEAGADLVVADLGALSGLDALPAPATGTDRLPSALDGLAEIRARGARPAVFLDYDGTLTPIVRRPQDAVLSDDMRAAVARLARRVPVAIVSGRDRRDVQSLVALEGLVYAGSHGFDIAGPEGEQDGFADSQALRPALAAAGEALARRLEGIPGVLLERKRYAVAVHVRETPPEYHAAVERAVDDVRAEHRGLRKGSGKMVLELRPDIDWDKGKAVLWLLGRLGLERPDVVPIYVGDDLTDEDAFRALRRAGRGIGVVVRDGAPRRTAAHFALDSPDELRRFLERLADTAS